MRNEKASRPLADQYRFVVSEPTGIRRDSSDNFTKSIRAEAQELGIFSEVVELTNNLKLAVHITLTPSPHTPNTVNSGNFDNRGSHYVIWYWLERNTDKDSLNFPGSIIDLALYPQYRKQIAQALNKAQQMLFMIHPETKSYVLYGATSFVSKELQEENGTGRGSQSNRYPHHHAVDLAIPKNQVQTIPLNEDNSFEFRKKIIRQIIKNNASRNRLWSSLTGSEISEWLVIQSWPHPARITFQLEPRPIDPKSTDSNEYISLHQPMGIQIHPKSTEKAWTIVEAYEVLLAGYGYLAQLYDVLVQKYYEYWELEKAQKITIASDVENLKKFPLSEVYLEDIFTDNTTEEIHRLMQKTRPTMQQIMRSNHPKSTRILKIYDRIRKKITDNSHTHPFPFSDDDRPVIDELLNVHMTPKEFIFSELLSSTWFFTFTPEGLVSHISISPNLGTTKSGFEHLTGLALERSSQKK